MELYCYNYGHYNISSITTMLAVIFSVKCKNWIKW